MAVNNLTTEQVQNHQSSLHSELKKHSITSVSAEFHHSKAPQPSHDLSQISARAHQIRGFSYVATNQLPQLLPRTPVTEASTTTELTDDNDFLDEEDLALCMAQDTEDEIRRASLMSLNSKAATSRRSSTIIPRNLSITSPLVILDTFTYRDIPLAERVYVELKDKDFLRIVHIIQDVSTSAVTLRGWKFRRTKELNGVIDRKLNEVCWILHCDDDDPRDPKVQGMETVSICEVVKRRRIRLTNQPFPALSWRDDGQKEKPETIETDRVLVCRFKYLCFYTNTKARAAYDWYEKGFHRLREQECDKRPDNDMKDEELRNVWRGHTVPGGAQAGWLPGEKEYLRQEDVSHKGITSRSSLKAPSGPDFPMGDPMKRGNVGSLLTEVDLQLSSDVDTQSASLGASNLAPTSVTIRSNDDVKHIISSPISPSREQQQDRRGSQPIFSGSQGFASGSGDNDTDGDNVLSKLRRGLRRSSIQCPRPRDIYPQIIEIDAQVTTSSSAGTFKKRYEGKITSNYYPTPRTIQRKHSADISFDSPARPTKRVCHGFRAESSKANHQNRYNDHGGQVLIDKSGHPYQESISSDNDNKSRTSRSNQRRYSFGDCFCGAGGMSRGAVSAGLRINWGFDFDAAACQSYQMNFFSTPVYKVWANQFSEAMGDHKVDICHLSPPCQFFSDAHTIQGKDDDMNTASLFAIFNLLLKARPRIVTLEQTSGLIRRHPIFFNAVINMFTSRGFSVRWKVMNCADFGLPQRRTRLFIMASCPGEALPPFPTPTHSADPEKTGLKPWTTINETIAEIPHGWANHEIHLAKERDSSPQSGDKIATCVTTSGGGIIHPSGKRDYTHREFACLQGFPLGHKFGVSGVKKQIGNSVPPTMAKVLLETVKNALLRADGLL